MVPVAERFTVGWSGFSALVQLRQFRRLWLVLGLSALGDWLGLLATAVFASAQVYGAAAKGVAFGSVIAVQLLPALILGPVAGVVADRYDRRAVMVGVDVLRFALFASIPAVALVQSDRAVVVGWAAVALFAAQAAALVWVPAKEAAVPNLLPRGLLEMANRLTLVTTYGVAPVAASLAFAGLSRLPEMGPVGSVDVAIWFDALTFLASAMTVGWGIREISGRGGVRRGRAGAGWRILRAAGDTPLTRGLTLGVLGAFAGCGVLVGASRFYAASLGGGDATFGLLFGALFAGFAVGVVAGPHLVGDLSRRRWFALSIILAGGAIASLAAAPRLLLAAVGAVIAGAGAGMAFLCGITLLGSQVNDAVRGRVIGLLQTGARVTLIFTIAVAGVVASVVPPRILLLLAGTGGIVVGVVTFKSIDDRPGVPVMADLRDALLRRRRSDTSGG